jgi:hypothetical protein
MISFRCGSCGKAYKVKPQHGGKRVRCPGCKVPIVLPFEMAAVNPPKAPAPSRKPTLVKQGLDKALVLTAVFFGLPLLLAIIGCLGLALVFAPSKEVREEIRVEQPTRNAEVANAATASKASTVEPDNRLEWVSLTYGSLIAYKNESRWTDTISATGKTLSEMEFRGKTDDYVELFNLNPAARDLLRLYNDRMECKHAEGWVVIGSGHWRTVPNSMLGTVGWSQRPAEIRDVKIVREPNAYTPSYKSSAGKTVHVRSYTRKDGTRVSSHKRSPPNSGISSKSRSRSSSKSKLGSSGKRR